MAPVSHGGHVLSGYLQAECWPARGGLPLGLGSGRDFGVPKEEGRHRNPSSSNCCRKEEEVPVSQGLRLAAQ